MTIIFGEYSPDIVAIPGGKSGNGVTTRYWDCCKPSCASKYWVKNATPVASCAVDGRTHILTDDKSGCVDGGDAYMCSNQTPWAVNSTMAYGFAAVSFSGGADTSLCCACLLLSFQGKLSHKKMVVQYTNTGGDLGTNHFDIAIPGGGLGIFTQGCQKQWHLSSSVWTVNDAAGCSKLPAALQSGCKFRFGFMEGESNPAVAFTQVTCPKEILAVTGCNTGH